MLLDICIVVAIICLYDNSICICLSPRLLKVTLKASSCAVNLWQTPQHVFHYKTDQNKHGPAQLGLHKTLIMVFHFRFQSPFKGMHSLGSAICLPVSRVPTPNCSIRFLPSLFCNGYETWQTVEIEFTPRFDQIMSITEQGTCLSTNQHVFHKARSARAGCGWE